LDVSGCDFRDEEGLFKIDHATSGSEFDVYVDYDGSFRIWNGVGDEIAPDREWEVESFAAALEGIAAWDEDVANWIDTPDLWDNNRSGNSSIPGEIIPDSANTPFTPVEQATISTQLKIIAETVKKTYELTAEQSAEIDKKFEEAEKASQRMGRKDWGMFFGGALLSLILCDAITPEVMGQILILVQHGVGHLFMGGPPPVGGILSAGQD
jgi:hypothetical protein